MTVHPVLAPAVLLIVAAVLVAARAQTLSAVLATTAAERRRPALWRWAAVTAALLALVVAAARPGLEAAAAQPDGNAAVASPSSNANVFLVVDRSVDTRVEDYGAGGSRMSGMRADMAAIIDAYPQARFALIGFASTPSIDWPLSGDTWSLKAFVAGLSPYVNVTPDAADRVDAAAAANVLRYQLIRADQQYPGSRNLVFYLGAGAGGSTRPQGGFSADGRVAGGAVLGYGTTGGGPIPGAYVDGTVTYLADATTGAPAVSALDEAELRRIADQLGVPYVHREAGVPVAGLLPVVPAGPAADSAVLTSTPQPRRVELYWVFALLAAGLLIPEIFLLVREFRRDRMPPRRRR
ncbi:hypothetical protein B1R94_16330 [Mycolicibacterium litorale]|nr:hypothetical protein B1R94_16330 [Mycolicibacterium litorale]